MRESAYAHLGNALQVLANIDATEHTNEGDPYALVRRSDITAVIRRIEEARSVIREFTTTSGGQYV